MPALAGLNKLYGNSAVRVVGVVIDGENTNTAGLIMKKTGAGFINLIDDGTFANYIFAVPQTYFINSQGTVVYSLLGPADKSQFLTIVGTLLNARG